MWLPGLGSVVWSLEGVPGVVFQQLGGFWVVVFLDWAEVPVVVALCCSFGWVGVVVVVIVVVGVVASEDLVVGALFGSAVGIICGIGESRLFLALMGFLRLLEGVLWLV